MVGPLKKRRPYTSFSISFIDSSLKNDTQWNLKNHLLEFNSPSGRHTGELIGKDLVATICKLQLEPHKVCPSVNIFLRKPIDSVYSWVGWLVMV